MIRISCERNRLQGWEKIRCGRAIGAVIFALKEFQKAVKQERAVEVDCQVVVKMGGEDGKVIDTGRGLSALQH